MTSDDSILGILISDSEGNHLAYSARQAPGTVPLKDDADIKRIGAMELLGLRLAPRPEQNAGKEEYVAYAYENFKILITELKNPPFVIGVKLPRAVNLEYVMNKVLLPYR